MTLASTGHAPFHDVIAAIETDEMATDRYRHLSECAECRALVRAAALRDLLAT